MFSAQYLNGLAAKTGFPAVGLQRQMTLLLVLREVHRHPVLCRAYALRGGTAINLFWFDIPRLSVDIDLNYIGSTDREEMRLDRPGLESQLARLLEALAISVERRPEDHAGGKWRLRAASGLGGSFTLAVDLNYLMRIPLFGTSERVAVSPDPDFATGFPVVSLEELYAGKLKALMERSAARDLYDAFRLASERRQNDQTKLRKALILFGMTAERDWRTLDRSSIESIDQEMIDRELSPLLRSGEAPDLGRMKNGVNTFLDELLRYDASEQRFMDAFLDQGLYHPEWLFGEEQGRILRSHPAVLWRLQSLRRSKGLDTEFTD